MRDAGPDTPADDPGLLASSVTTLRLMIGWAGAGLGILGLSMGIDTGPGTTDGSYLLFHAILLVTGLILMSWNRFSTATGRPGLVAGGLVAVLGPLLSAVPATSSVCCLREFPVRHGFPFTMLARGDGGWHTDGGAVASDLVFWACVGFLTLAAAAMVPRLRPAGRVLPPDLPGRHPTHAEGRAADARAAQDENVGGLP
jgi:hypothetical protein